MNRKQRTRLTWILVALGGAAIVLCVALLVAAPADWSQYHAKGMYGRHQWAGTGIVQPGGQDQTAPSAGGRVGEWAGHGKGGHGGLLLFAGAAILIAVVAFGHRRGRDHGHVSAEELLKRQFAEGKISEAEYRSRLAAIRE